MSLLAGKNGDDSNLLKIKKRGKTSMAYDGKKISLSVLTHF